MATAMKMSGCMKIVAKMPQTDQDALLARLDQYQADGIPAEQAQMMAARDMLAEIQADREQLFSAIAEQHPDLLTVAKPAPAKTKKQAPFAKSERQVEDRAGISQLAYQGYEKAEVPVVQSTRKLSGLVKKLDEGKLTPEQFELQVRILAQRMREVSAVKDANRILSERQRGADIVREKLIAARRRNELDFDTVEFALWALQQNPAIAEGLGISIREQPENQRGAAGNYSAAAAIMRVFKGVANEGTAVHEILHHTERMMPAEVQNGIRNEWAKQYSKALAEATGEVRDALAKFPEAMAGDQKAQDAVRAAFKDGVLDADLHYQLTNPSEFWAVNATDILRGRYEADSWIGKAKQWLSEMLEKVKGILGARSDAAVLKGLQAVLDGNGQRLSKKMLTDLASFNAIENNQTDTPEFKAWFGDSKVVDENGQPLVVYHSTTADFDTFDTTRRAIGGEGSWFSSTPSSSPATEEGSNIMPVYLSLQNPKVIDLMRESDDVLKKKFIEQGYDGVVMKRDGKIATAVAFYPTQIKSATGNQGTFDPANPDIRRSSRQTEGWILSRDEAGRFRFGAGAKLYKLTALVANNVLDKVGMKPMSTELKRALRKMKLEVERAQSLAAGVAVNLKDIPEDQRKMISDVIEGELAVGITPPQQVLDLAASMQSIMTEQSQELVRLGMLTDEAAARWDGKYLPRFYESKFKDEVNAWLRAAKSLFGRARVMQGIKGDSLKARGMFETIDVADLANYQSMGWEIRDEGYDPATSTEVQVWRDFTRAERDGMGEIRDAMFRFVMGYTRSQRDIALGRLYESLAASYASRTQKEGFVKVPDSLIDDTKVRRYGKLAGMWVPKEIMDHLAAYDESMQNGLFKIYRAGLSKWKEGKTVLNPVSHANNVISNVTMAHFAGVSYWEGWKYAGAVKDFLANNATLQEAKDAGLFGGTFNQAEIVKSMPPQLRALAGMSESKVAKLGEGIWDVLAFTVSWNGKKYGVRPVAQWAYENEDLFFRYLIYRDARKRGLDPDEAVDFSQRYIFTYDDLPKGARLVRDLAVPFFSYTYKVMPVLARTALEYPWRFAAPAAVLYTINAAMYAMAAGADDDDWTELLRRYITDDKYRQKARALEADERQNLPPWMKGYSFTLGVPKAIRLGMDDVTNLPMFLDVSRIFPGGDIADVAANAGGVPLLQPLMPSNPVLSTLAAMLWNKDTFFGKEVVDSNDTRGEATEKRSKWLWQQFTPAIAIGNYHFDRAMNALANAQGKPVDVGFRDYTGLGRDGLPVQPGLTALQAIGVKLRPIDLDMSAKISESQKRRMLSDIQAEIRRLDRLERKGAITPEAAEKERDRQKLKRERLREGLTVDGEER